ncbi:ABC transporter ATP-binding protein [Bradyrhizobium sp. SSBR45G]|uniref:ABC transporter ATP-binding protein n=1 Tax=unclassified Bradyrhizobium TaxID=2631580 RepID=UPI002342A446|nr:MULTISPECIES: ATP-binding cassette domain-containing protein [unclassified Bradyrhizobium]GLH76653.1 ABC transporter ATP-binding protein [Bradyrhizobium sp. SSBR45G]GLH84266.1 ABC transporter ATP-binding protein [Bradyrhizobium sp. SSBR45R]
MTLLAITGLTKRFGGLLVFDQLSFSLGRGERLGVVGPNGAGKSTLFNLISGVVAPNSGSISFDGSDLKRSDAWTRCHLGIGRTFQIPKPFGDMTVFENLMVAATYGRGLSMRAARAHCDDVIAQTRLSAKAARPAGSLMLADLKRLELARALALKPKLLLLDEIAGGLTTAECDELLSILDSIQDQAISVIWIEHVVAALTRYVTRILVLAQGRAIADGSPSSVFADPKVRTLYLGEDDA